jgi:hypothetical protein
MITFECTDKNCSQGNVKIDFLGNIETAQCGGCNATLFSTDERRDPELPTE